MGIQINGNTDIISATDGSLTIQGASGNLTGNVTGNINSSGVSTLGNTVVGGGTTQLVVTGNARITGILTIGTSSITLDGSSNQVNVGTGVTLHHTNGVQVGGNNLHSTVLTVNNINASGVSTFSSGIVVAAGSSAAPSITPTGDSNTGIFFPSADTIAFGEGGAEALRIDSSGNVGIGTTNSSSKLNIGGETAQYPISLQVYSTLHSTSRRAAIGLGGTAGNTTPDWMLLQDRNGNGTKNFGVYNTTISENLLTISSTLISEPNYYVSTPNNSTGETYGLDVGYRRAVAISGNVSANTWTNTGITQKSTNDQGIFLLDVWVDTYNCGGESYQTSYVGWFVLPNRSANDSRSDSIAIHRAGHAPNTEVLQFRTLIEYNVNGGRIYLQFLTNKTLTGLDGTGGKSITVAIHRFASPINSI